MYIVARPTLLSSGRTHRWQLSPRLPTFSVTDFHCFIGSSPPTSQTYIIVRANIASVVYAFLICLSLQPSIVTNVNKMQTAMFTMPTCSLMVFVAVNNNTDCRYSRRCVFIVKSPHVHWAQPAMSVAYSVGARVAAVNTII